MNIGTSGWDYPATATPGPMPPIGMKIFHCCLANHRGQVYKTANLNPSFHSSLNPPKIAKLSSPMFQFLRNHLWDDLPGKATPTGPYIFDAPSGGRWAPSSSIKQTCAYGYACPLPSIPFSTLKPLTLLTWNIDAARPHPEQRVRAAVRYLRTLSAELVDRGATLDVVQMQEVHPLALEALLGEDWVRDSYAVTNLYLPAYSKKYGSVTLISRQRLKSVVRCFRMHFDMSVMGRDALVVDFKAEDGVGVVRVVNVHLESLQGYGMRARRTQMEELRDIAGRRGVRGSVVAGDVNAIAPEDEELAERCGFVDLWVEQIRSSYGGESRDRKGDGKTWGYQPPSDFPPGRLDRVLVSGDVSGDVEVVGKGVRHTDVWASDHFALLATIKLGGNITE
ncbi:hypothetical protein BJ508DRAFT_414784 [Ascobolus immersus RN42]|uniref:Endonuclease/exonuclease/phosphatase domain-containing protein n=1 Tax=Ascobolus immersus RN42 TaxID=1160509 RepID=A0A3N4I5J2_ASCIM|nr:hypothetical protein BJ508DRAFT_414784 [Ascobolus immersus RN42]